MTVTAHNKRRVYSGATHPAPLAPLDERNRPAKRPAPPLRKTALDRLPENIRIHAYDALTEFWDHVRKVRQLEFIESEKQRQPNLIPITHPGDRREEIKAWLKESGPNIAANIAKAVGLNQGSDATKYLREGIPGVGVVGSIRLQTGGPPATLWGIVDDEKPVTPTIRSTDYAPRHEAAERIKAWLQDNGSASAPQIAVGLGAKNPSNIRRDLHAGIPGVEIVKTIRNPKSGKPVMIWGIKTDATIYGNPD
jgi:hypothetical protein